MKVISSKRIPDIEDILPHRGPMLLLTQIKTIDLRGVVCIGWIERELFLSHAESAPPILGLEMGAQAAGVHQAVASGLDETQASSSQRGFLVGIRQARFYTHSLPTGVTLQVEALQHGAAGPLAIYDISVLRRHSNEILVQGRVSIWVEQQPPSG